jgi:hypothetical protein
MESTRAAIAPIQARIGLAETHQRLALLLDAADREPALAAIAPGRVRERREHVGWRHMPDAFEVLHEHALLGDDLPRLVVVLQRATAARAEVAAAGVHALGRGFEDLDRARLVEAAMPARLDRHHLLAGKRAGDEHGLAVGTACDAAPVVGQVGDLGGKRGEVEAGHGDRCGKRPRIVADAVAPP